MLVAAEPVRNTRAGETEGERDGWARGRGKKKGRGVGWVWSKRFQSCMRQETHSRRRLAAVQ